VNRNAPSDRHQKFAGNLQEMADPASTVVSMLWIRVSGLNGECFPQFAQRPLFQEAGSGAGGIRK
jgi:hypothetical protein